jgi:hypothetical protein
VIDRLHQPVLQDGRQSSAALAIQRGTCRLLLETGFHPLTEFTLANGRRTDITAVGPKGGIWIVEIKSGVADFRADKKWPDYTEFCDRFFFAASPDMALGIFPETAGLIVADRFGGEIIRTVEQAVLNAARRKAVMLRFARSAAARLQDLADPNS